MSIMLQCDVRVICGGMRLSKGLVDLARAVDSSVYGFTMALHL